MRYFWKKAVKIAEALPLDFGDWRSAPNPTFINPL